MPGRPGKLFARRLQAHHFAAAEFAFRQGTVVGSAENGQPDYVRPLFFRSEFFCPGLFRIVKALTRLITAFHRAYCGAKTGKPASFQAVTPPFSAQTFV
ncbi:MAG: hypothetical protein EHM45_02500 [Desulfobacteraceae bacterium]|nr:MAG: hypothetical protein EHM45_02500 [Desulfobacteraceae bacterium]